MNVRCYNCKKVWECDDSEYILQPLLVTCPNCRRVGESIMEDKYDDEEMFAM